MASKLLSSCKYYLRHESIRTGFTVAISLIFLFKIVASDSSMSEAANLGSL
jgi:hypothetical protein